MGRNNGYIKLEILLGKNHDKLIKMEQQNL